MADGIVAGENDDRSQGYGGLVPDVVIACIEIRTPLISISIVS